MKSHTPNKQAHKSTTYTICRSMWYNWAISYGAITLPIAGTLILPRLLIPAVCFIEIYILSSIIQGNTLVRQSGCSLVIKLATRVLAPAMIIMLGIVILCTDFLIPRVIHFEIYNPEIPFISCLIIYPITAVMCIISLLTKYNNRHCRECRRINNIYAGDSIIGDLFYRESRHQIWLLLMISLLLGSIEYWYYFFYYINTNINSADRWVFAFMPLAIYGISLIVMYSRYISIYELFTTVDEAKSDRSHTSRIRFIVICGNEIVLQPNKNDLFDTFAERIIPYCQNLDSETAAKLFKEISGYTDFKLRYCYTSNDLAAGANTIHFAAFIPESVLEQDTTNNVLPFNAHMLDAIMQNGTIAPTLANEIYRIHTITMAWKTYDRQGRRIYPIKKYRPSFRIGDLAKWQVDYDDNTWLAIAHNNEDRYFFRLRRLWHHMLNKLSSSKLFSH